MNSWAVVEPQTMHPFPGDALSLNGKVSCQNCHTTAGGHSAAGGHYRKIKVSYEDADAICSREWSRGKWKEQLLESRPASMSKYEEWGRVEGLRFRRDRDGLLALLRKTSAKKRRSNGETRAKRPFVSCHTRLTSVPVVKKLLKSIGLLDFWPS